MYPSKYDLVLKKGRQAVENINDLAQLRITVFRDYPYLYAGDFEYEKKYLNTYFASNNSFVALCMHNNKVVGASTAILLADEEESFKAPFAKKNLNPNEICYFGESILLPQYRGQGIGKAFMDARLAFAKNELLAKFAVFCAVFRPNDHAKKPKNYLPLDEFWRSYNFEKIPNMTTNYKWKEIDEEIESEHQMQFWMRKI